MLVPHRRLSRNISRIALSGISGESVGGGQFPTNALFGPIGFNCNGPILGSYRRSRHTTDSPTDSPWERRRGFLQTCQMHELRQPTKANLSGRTPDIRSCFGLPIPNHPMRCVSTLRQATTAVTMRRICSGETTAATWPRFSAQNNSRPEQMRLPQTETAPATALSDTAFSPPSSTSIGSTSRLSLTRIWQFVIGRVIGR
jgi:hypothetical protein